MGVGKKSIPSRMNSKSKAFCNKPPRRLCDCCRCQAGHKGDEAGEVAQVSEIGT